MHSCRVQLGCNCEEYRPNEIDDEPNRQVHVLLAVVGQLFRKHSRAKVEQSYQQGPGRSGLAQRKQVYGHAGQQRAEGGSHAHLYLVQVDVGPEPIQQVILTVINKTESEESELNDHTQPGDLSCPKQVVYSNSCKIIFRHSRHNIGFLQRRPPVKPCNFVKGCKGSQFKLLLQIELRGLDQKKEQQQGHKRRNQDYVDLCRLPALLPVKHCCKKAGPQWVDGLESAEHESAGAACDRFAQHRVVENVRWGHTPNKEQRASEQPDVLLEGRADESRRSQHPAEYERKFSAFVIRQLRQEQKAYSTPQGQARLQEEGSVLVVADQRGVEVASHSGRRLGNVLAPLGVRQGAYILAAGLALMVGTAEGFIEKEEVDPQFDGSAEGPDERVDEVGVPLVAVPTACLAEEVLGWATVKLKFCLHGFGL